MNKRKLKAWVKELEAELARWREHSRVRIKQMDDLKADNDKLSSQVVHLQSKYDKTEADRQRWMGEAINLQDVLAKRQPSPRKREMDVLHVRNGQLQKNYEDSQEVITRLTRDLAAAQAKLEPYKAENHRLLIEREAYREKSLQFEKLTNDLAVCEAYRRDELREREELRADIKGLVELLDKAKGDQAQLEAELANLRERPTLPASPDQTS